MAGEGSLAIFCDRSCSLRSTLPGEGENADLTLPQGGSRGTSGEGSLSLTDRIVRERDVLCSNGVPSGLTLLDDVGQSLQGIILVGVGEIGCAAERCGQTSA
jgi:hypothetical protein